MVIIAAGLPSPDGVCSSSSTCAEHSSVISPRVSTYAVIERIWVSSPGTSSWTTKRPRNPAVRSAPHSQDSSSGVAISKTFFLPSNSTSW